MTTRVKIITVHFNNKASKLTADEKYHKLQDVMNYIFYLSSQEGHRKDIVTTYYPCPDPYKLTFVFASTAVVAQKLQQKFPDATIKPGGTPYGVMMRKKDRP